MERRYVKFYDLKVWKDAHLLTLEIYKQTEDSFPKEEILGLASQIRRSSSSIRANIAEGCELISVKTKINYLHIAKATTVETQNHLLLARDLGYISQEVFEKLFRECDNILSQLGGWIKKIKENET